VSTSRGQSRAINVGWVVFVTLIVLIVLEYLISLVLTANLPIMVTMNVVDAVLIMIYFMHVSRVWPKGKTEEGA
jgi:heme/copper-type cytochrome/quinol oxidase subunit 4